MTPADRFAAAVTLALELPAPEDIWRQILATADDGLRAANYEARVRGGGNTAVEDVDPTTGETITYSIQLTPTERTALRERHDDQGEGLKLSRARERFIDAISALNAECCDAGSPDTWDEAIKDAHILAETGVLQAALDVGRNVVKWINQAETAVKDISRVYGRHCARIPDDFDRNHKDVNNAYCRSCARIGVESKRATKMLCDWCYRHVTDLEIGGIGYAVDLQLERRYWPTEDMLRSRGRRTAVARDRRDWLAKHGLAPMLIDRLRSTKRAG